MPEPGQVIDLKTPPKQKILVADDEQDIASLIEDWLSDLFEVTMALNGKTAVQKAIWHRPEIILLDVVMPDMGGYEVVRMLQGAPQTQTIPVIVMTAKNFDDSTIQMIKAEPNVYGFINKPFKPSELIKMVQMVLAGGRTFTPGISAGGQGPSASETPPPPAPPSAPAPLPSPSVEPGSTAPEAVLAQRAVDRSRERFVPPGGMGPRAPAGRSAFSDDGGGAGNSPGRWGRRALIRLVLCLSLAAGVSFLGMEWAVRRTEGFLGRRLFVPPVFAASSFNSFVPYQWYNPKITKPTFWDDGTVVYRFNQWGLRGPDFPLVAPEGVTRILVLGGSFVFGKGRTEGDTLAHRLETRLNQAKPGAYQVINAGLWALSPEEQWAYAEGQGFNFKPRVLLWLVEARAPGDPLTGGLRWLTGHRWLVDGPLGQSRLIRLLVQNKIGGEGDSLPRANDPLYKKAEALARARGVALHLWRVPAWNGRDLSEDGGLRWIPSPDGPEATYINGLADRLAQSVWGEGNIPLDKTPKVE